MVKGLDVFRAWFADYPDQYILIGGTAATLAMEEAGLDFRATKDLECQRCPATFAIARPHNTHPSRSKNRR